MFLTQLERDSKIGLGWKSKITDNPAIHEEWLRQGYNLGMPVEENNRVVLDFDKKEPAREFYKEYPQLCTVIVETRRGVHLHFYGKTKTRKLIWKDEEAGDLKGNGYVVYPPSVIKGWTYLFVRNTVLQPFPEHLFENHTTEVSTKIEANIDRLQMITRAMAYTDLIESTQSCESEGDTVLFRLACKLVRQPPNGFGLSIEEAWPIAITYNKRCNPQWRVERIRYKLEEAVRKDG